MDTKQKIVDEYKTLVKEHKTADISVAEICRSLGISRKTFYNYFRDRYAIVETIMFDEIEKPLLKAIDAEFSRKDLKRAIFKYRNATNEKDKELYKKQFMAIYEHLNKTDSDELTSEMKEAWKILSQ